MASGGKNQIIKNTNVVVVVVVVVIVTLCKVYGINFHNYILPQNLQLLN